MLGVSFGGFVAQEYAAAHPEHPAGLILISTGPRFAGLDETVERFREVGGEGSWPGSHSCSKTKFDSERAFV